MGTTASTSQTEMDVTTTLTPRQGELFPNEQTWREQLAETFRTRLNAIIGFSELLGMEALSPNGRNDLKQVMKAARDLLGVVNHQLGAPASERAAAPAPGQIRGRGCDLLYIEDDIANVTLIERILELRPGMSLKHATHGRRGIEMAMAENPRLILLDLNLPDINGSEVLDVLQSNPETSDIPVVVLSANVVGAQIERLLASGARNYLTKPFELDHFLAVLDEWTRPVETAAQPA
jgi:CheY-like chemotaxis protein